MRCRGPHAQKPRRPRATAACHTSGCGHTRFRRPCRRENAGFAWRPRRRAHGLNYAATSARARWTASLAHVPTVRVCVRCARARGTAEWRPSKTESIAAMLCSGGLSGAVRDQHGVHLGSPNASASCGRSGASALLPDRMYSEITRPSCCCAAANPRRHRQSCICMRRAAPGAWRGSDTRRQRRQAGGQAGGRAAGRLWRDRPWASRGACKARLALGRSDMGLWVGRPRRQSGEVGVNHQVLLSHHSRDERRSVCAGRAQVAAEANAGMRRRRIARNSVRRRTAAAAAVSRRQTSWVPNNPPAARRCARKAGTLRPAAGTNLDGGTGGYPMRDRHPTSTLTHSLTHSTRLDLG
jgi:hypothetical protein